MQKNRISAVIAPDVLSKVEDHLAEVSLLLKPVVHGLSAEERGSLTKMGDRSVAFVDKTSSYCETNSEFAPVFMEIPELNKDLQLVKALKPVLDTISVLKSDIDDTMLLAGSEAYTAARFYYNSVSFAAKEGNLAAKPIADDLRKRFPGPKGKGKGSGNK